MVQTTSAQKTKSKTRYLKAKKERRKKRLKAASTSTNAPTRSYTTGAELSSDEDEADIKGIVLPSNQEIKLLQSAEPQGTTGKRKHKRRTPSPLENDEDETISEQTELPRSPPLKSALTSSLPTLPSFPLPVHPAPPSKAVLALQGLDRAILEAEVIDPAASAPVPLSEGSDPLGLGLDDQTRRRLAELGIESLFAVQTVLLPFLLSTHALHCPYDPPQDACVSAPTGSGKTLAYVVPITQMLSARVVVRLRALIVLPTRDLVAQVRETFEAVAKGRGLRIATATGQHSFVHEQSQLVQCIPSSSNHSTAQYHSKIDVLICTPGRLTDHLHSTPGFSLEHLRFLVIDEADRLITQSFQDWLAHVLNATQLPSSEFLPTELDEPQSSSCQKLLFSATLTHDPSKIAPLGLRNPRYFVIGERSDLGAEEERFAFPTTLSEHMCVCSPTQKPLVFFHLVHALGVRNALVFTKSAESTARLVQLFEFFEAARGVKETNNKSVIMKAYSSDLSAAERKGVIELFKQGAIDLLVCSDLVARGVDISHVTHVVSYDVPVDMRKYVHRMGRTARAGRTGDAWSLVEDQEARYFKQMLGNAGHLDAVKRLRIKDKDLLASQEYYEAALQSLKELYSKTKS